MPGASVLDPHEKNTERKGAMKCRTRDGRWDTGRDYERMQGRNIGNDSETKRFEYWKRV